jgi:hypothetical protein
LDTSQKLTLDGDTSKTVIPTTKQEVKEKVKEEAAKKAGDLLNGLFNKKK